MQRTAKTGGEYWQDVYVSYSDSFPIMLCTHSCTCVDRV